MKKRPVMYLYVVIERVLKRGFTRTGIAVYFKYKEGEQRISSMRCYSEVLGVLCGERL
jgi:hypothetical protein